MDWVIMVLGGIIWIIIISLLYFIYAKSKLEKQLKKLKEEYDESKNKSIPPTIRNEFRRDIPNTLEKNE